MEKVPRGGDRNSLSMLSLSQASDADRLLFAGFPLCLPRESQRWFFLPKSWASRCELGKGFQQDVLLRMRMIHL